MNDTKVKVTRFAKGAEIDIFNGIVTQRGENGWLKIFPCDSDNHKQTIANVHRTQVQHLGEWFNSNSEAISVIYKQ